MHLRIYEMSLALKPQAVKTDSQEICPYLSYTRKAITKMANTAITSTSETLSWATEVAECVKVLATKTDKEV